ncbi:MAG: hypothetical protein AAGJ50_04450 [Pseudomonadota bacterium]
MPKPPQLELPSYDTPEHQSHSFELDPNVGDYSYVLKKWAISKIKQSMDGIERRARLADIYEENIRIEITASTSIIANVSFSTVHKSPHHPDGAYRQYTYLFNRSTNTLSDLRHLFSDSDMAGKALRDVFIDRVATLRADKFDVEISQEGLRTDTDGRLPDDVFELNVNLSDPTSQAEFSGITVSVSDRPQFNYLDRTAYAIDIDPSEFFEFLKPECQSLFPDPS